MGSNMYLYEKARESHDQDLLREMAESRLLEHLPRRRLSRRAAAEARRTAEAVRAITYGAPGARMSRIAEGVSPRHKAQSCRAPL